MPALIVQMQHSILSTLDNTSDKVVQLMMLAQFPLLPFSNPLPTHNVDFFKAVKKCDIRVGCNIEMGKGAKLMHYTLKAIIYKSLILSHVKYYLLL